jgi:hypothetical protein
LDANAKSLVGLRSTMHTAGPPLVSEHLKNVSSTRRLGHQTHISELVLAGASNIRQHRTFRWNQEYPPPLKRPDGRLRGLDSALILEPDSYSFGFVAAMWDRYDPRSSDGRDRGDSYDRTRGTCDGSNDCDRTDERDPRDVFTKDVDLRRGRERQPWPP